MSGEVKKFRILCVDDSMLHEKFKEMFADQPDIEIVCVVNAEQAVVEMESELPDVLVTEMRVDYGQANGVASVILDEGTDPGLRLCEYFRRLEQIQPGFIEGQRRRLMVLFSNDYRDGINYFSRIVKDRRFLYIEKPFDIRDQRAFLVLIESEVAVWQRIDEN